MSKLSLWNITAWVAHDDNPPQLYVDHLLRDKHIVAVNASAAKDAAQAEANAVNATLDEPYDVADIQINVMEIKANV